MNWFMLPLYILAWILRILVEVPLWIIGFILVPLFTVLKLYEERDSKYFTDKKTGLPRRILAWKGGWLTWLWGNEEDGIDGKHYMGVGFGLDKPFFKRVFQWSAARNAVGNFRFVPFFNPRITPSKIKYESNCRHPITALANYWKAGGDGTGDRPVFWSFTTQGIYAGLALKIPTSKTTAHRFMIGWKIYPEDADIDPKAFINTSRYPYCGFGLQFTLNRVGG